MSCAPYDLRDYVFGELPHTEAREVEKHVEACGSCNEEVERLRLTTSALLTLRDEEPPRRIAFVSDPVFEPRWWQRIWRSGPQLGFASAAMLAGAILLHGWMGRPVTETVVRTAAPVEKRLTQEEVARVVQAAVRDSEARQSAEFRKALSAQQRGSDLQHRAAMTQMAEYVEFVQKRMNVMLRASNDAAPEMR